MDTGPQIAVGRPADRLVGSTEAIVAAVAIVLLVIVAMVVVTNREVPDPLAASLGGGGGGPVAVATSLPAGTAFAPTGLDARRWVAAGRSIRSVAGASAAKAISVALAPAGGHGVAASIETASDQLGLAVRVKDAQNLWFLAPVPQFGAWRLAKLVGGTVVQSFPIPLLGSKPGTQAALVTDGDALKVVIDGRVRLSITDAALADQSGVGYVALAAVAGGWTDGRVLP